MSYSRWFGFNNAGPTLGGGFIVSVLEAGEAQSLSLTKRIATVQLGNFAALSLLGIRLQVSVDCCLPLFAHASIFFTQLTYVVVELGI